MEYERNKEDAELQRSVSWTEAKRGGLPLWNQRPCVREQGEPSKLNGDGLTLFEIMEGDDQVLICAAVLRPQPVMGLMIMLIDVKMP